MFFSFSSLFLTALITSVSASNVVELNPDNFDDFIGKGKHALVEFYAPWCGHCQNLEPIYEQVADAFAHISDKVIIAKVNADGVGKPLGQRFGVQSYPTLKWFSADGKEEPYSSGRDFETIVGFVQQQAAVTAKLPVPPPTNVENVDVHTWEEVVEKSDKHVLVSFTAPWCGHCKSLKPIYEKVATTFKPESECLVVNIDANEEKNADISAKFGVQGFPTLKFFPKGDKEHPVEYEGGRSEEDLVRYLNEKCVTERAVGGGLNEKAGRHPHLDALAQKFYKAPSDTERKSLHKEAKAVTTQNVSENNKKGGTYYLYVMDKVVSGPLGTGYVDKESKRLSKILEKRNLSAAKLDEIQIKVNVLKAFVEEGDVEAKSDDEKVKEKVGRAEAEL